MITFLISHEVNFLRAEHKFWLYANLMCGLHLMIGVPATERHPLRTYRYLIGKVPSPTYPGELIKSGALYAN